MEVYITTKFIWNNNVVLASFLQLRGNYNSTLQYTTLPIFIKN